MESSSSSSIRVWVRSLSIGLQHVQRLYKTAVPSCDRYPLLLIQFQFVWTNDSYGTKRYKLK